MSTMVATKQQLRDPHDPIQVLRTKKYGGVKVAGKSWMDGPGAGKIIVLTPEGGYRFARGGPIRSEQDILDIIPEGPDRDRALDWWANKDNWQKIAPRKLTFSREGYPIYEDTGEFVDDGGVIQSYFPNGPVQWGALQAMLNRQQGVKEAQSVTLKSVQGQTNPSPQPAAQEVPEVEHKIAKPPPLDARRGKKLSQAELTKRRANRSLKAAAAAGPKLP